MAQLSNHQYGKTKVRLFTVDRPPASSSASSSSSAVGGTQHVIRDLTVEILLSGGAFERAFTSQDNSTTVPTDTVKNTVYVLASKMLQLPLELLALGYADHFLSKYADLVETVQVRVEEHGWKRMNAKPSEKPVKVEDVANHPFSFTREEAVRSVKVTKKRGEKTPHVVSSLSNFVVLKTTESGFENFHRCENTTLQAVTDRLFCTSVTADWEFAHFGKHVDFDQVFAAVKNCTMEVFANRYSKSVQQTIYEAGELILKKAPAVSQVSFTMPNLHVNLVDLSKFSQNNVATVYVPTTEPSGLIKGTIARKASKL